MTEIHLYIAYSIPTAFFVLALWALASILRNKNPNDWFWNLLAAIQVVIAIQVIVGATLFMLGDRPDSNGPQWLHYVYGGLFPGGTSVV